MKYNSELQFIDNLDKAYLLGLFYADGYVGTNTGDCGIVGLAQTHKNLFERIQQQFPFFRITKHSVTSAGNLAIKLQCGSVLLKSHLMLHGLLPRKSYENRNRTFLPVLNRSLCSSFLRGFFDGDGYLVQSNTRNKMRLGMGGVNAYFMCDILSLLHSEGINLTLRIRGVEEMNNGKKKWEILSRQEMYYIESLSFEQTRKFVKYIYQDGNLFLRYKRDLAEQVLLYADLRVREMNSRPDIPCPKCNQSRCTYNGVRGKVPRQRMVCLKCNYKFTIDLSNIAPIDSNVNGAQDQLAHQELGYAV